MELAVQVQELTAHSQEGNERLEAALAGRAALEAEVNERLGALSQHMGTLGANDAWLS